MPQNAFEGKKRPRFDCSKRGLLFGIPPNHLVSYAFWHIIFCLSTIMRKNHATMLFLRIGIEFLCVVSYHLHTIFYGGGPCGTQKKSIRLSSKNSYRESFRNTPKSASLRNGGNHLFPYFVPILGKKKRL